MIKKFLTILMLVVVISGFFALPNDTSAQGYAPQINTTQNSGSNAKAIQDSSWWQSMANYIFEAFAKGIGYFLMIISSFFLVISGLIFDWIVDLSIIKMGADFSTGGIGLAITSAWATLRDIANMLFIFILLYAAFQAMFSLSFSSVGTTIRNIIIVALLMNFSLFISKVVIDASNIVSIGFYKSVIGNSYLLSQTDTGGQPYNSSVGTATFTGISGGYMKMLGLQTFFGSNFLSNASGAGFLKILTLGIMTFLFMMIAAIILLVAAVMFIARYIIIIFLLILSPLALIASIIPNFKNQFDKWKKMLIDQAVFAPVFFALTWVSFRLGNAIIGDTSSNTQWADLISSPGSAGVQGILINYVLIIGFAIAALVISKQIASSTAGFSAITGGIMSGTAFAGRQSIGRASNLVLQSKTMRDAANSNKWYAGAARAGLWAGYKGSQGSFDVRGIGNTALGKAVGAGEVFKGMGSAGGKGGFRAAVEAKEKDKAKYAKDVYGATPADKALDEEMQKRSQGEVEQAKVGGEEEVRKKRKEVAEQARAQYKDKQAGVRAYEKEKMRENFNNLDTLKKQKADKERELAGARARGANDLELRSIQDESDSISKSIAHENEVISEKRKDLEETDDVYVAKKEAADEAKEAHNTAKKAIKAKIKDEEYSEEIQRKIAAHKEFKKSAQRRQEAYANRIKGGIFGWTQGNQAAARKVAEQAKGKTAKDEFAEAAKKLAKEEEDQNKTEPEPTPSSTPTPAPTPPPKTP